VTSMLDMDGLVKDALHHAPERGCLRRVPVHLNVDALIGMIVRSTASRSSRPHARCPHDRALEHEGQQAMTPRGLR
jgi:hypothetical protein